MPNDSLYRIGGDEFILISNDYKKDDIIKKLEKLFKLRLYNTTDIDKFSAGIVINDTGITIQSAEERADKILYDVKNLKEEYYRFYK
jgi:GGDEF domain-containing protein